MTVLNDSIEHRKHTQKENYFAISQRMDRETPYPIELQAVIVVTASDYSEEPGSFRPDYANVCKQLQATEEKVAGHWNLWGRAPGSKLQMIVWPQWIGRLLR